MAEPLRFMLHYTGTAFEDKQYTLGAAPTFSQDEWLAGKKNLGLEYPNVSELTFLHVCGALKI